MLSIIGDIQGENYKIVKNGKSYIRKGLHNGEALNLELFNTLNFAVMIQEKTGGFTVYKKYLLRRFIYKMTEPFVK